MSDKIQNPLQLRFLEQFRSKPDSDIIQDLNREAQCKGWTGSRAAYLWALREEMIYRNWDYSAISSGENSMFLRYEVKLSGNKVEIIRDIF